MKPNVVHYYDDSMKDLKVSVTFYPFWTEIAKFKEDGYYYLHLYTTPRCREIDVEKRFRYPHTAVWYYYKQLKKVLNNTIEEMDIWFGHDDDDYNDPRTTPTEGQRTA